MSKAREKFITLRATEAELQGLKDVAKRNKENVSDLLRSRIFYSQKKPA